MNILVTGSSGFIGKNLITHLKGHKVKEVSIRSYNKINIISDEIDIVIHLAGKAHDLKKVSKPIDYYEANFELTKSLYNDFVNSKAKIFIFISSIKALSDTGFIELTEDMTPNPKTHYGISKLMAEEYIVSKNTCLDKKFFILRPCMIHGPGNKGNLNLLYKMIFHRFPWPLGQYNNKRSFCNIDNFCFIINELINQENINSGIFHIADDEAISTNELVILISTTIRRNLKILNLNKKLIQILTKFGDLLHLPLNSETLQKLTETYLVSNKKIKSAINKELPISTKTGLINTINSYNKLN